MKRLILLAALVAAAPAQGDAPDRGMIETVIREYILENPEIVMQAIEKLQERQALAEREADRKLVAAAAKEIFEDPDSPVGGNPGGDVTLVEFFDYRCGVCKRVHPVVAELVDSDPGLRRVYKEWPILGPESLMASRPALASRGQGKYLAFHDALMEARSPLDEDAVMRIAAAAGIDTGRLRDDMSAPEIEETIRRNHELAARLGLNGTPSFLVGGRIVRGGRDLDSMRALVAEARERK